MRATDLVCVRARLTGMALQSPEDGLVDYKEFLESFEIVDVAWGGVMPSTAASPNRKK